MTLGAETIRISMAGSYRIGVRLREVSAVFLLFSFCLFCGCAAIAPYVQPHGIGPSHRAADVGT